MTREIDIQTDLITKETTSCNESVCYAMKLCTLLKSECPNVAAEHRSNKMTLTKGLMFAQQEAVKILIRLREIPLRQVECHRRFVDLLPMTSLGAAKELDVSSHS